MAHIERTLAESYRKEIDQEENIWRSLPFFAATLALQLASLFQVIDRLPSGLSLLAVGTHGLAAASILCSLGALGMLASSIFPAKFRYIAKDADLLDYTLGLIADERDPANRSQPAPIEALATLKTDLATQYAVATDHNRQINKRRDKRRSIAGLLTICSVIATLMLVSVAVATYVGKHDDQGASHGLPPASVADPAPARRTGP